MKNNLSVYNKKRDFNITNEPEGKKVCNRKKLRFVVQHHMASKEHYDLRLEWDGVLKSWAVPKGPSYNRKDKRLAILVEDHPFDYRNFEGVIPKGEYGGGVVMLFDEGYYEPLINLNKGFKDGVIKFRLYGKRLKGIWALLYFKENNWLLVKEKDKYFEFNDIKTIDKSVRTGRTMKEIECGLKKEKNNTISGIEITNPKKIIYENAKNN